MLPDVVSSVEPVVVVPDGVVDAVDADEVVSLLPTHPVLSA